MTISALYGGHVSHQRFAPRRHRLRYAMFQLLLDLDELSDLDRRLRWFSLGRFNLIGFHDADHGDGRGGPLKAYVIDTLAQAGIDLAGGSVQLLCMPRVLGYVFNPLSLYYCRRPDGSLAAMLYEVSNTFGQRHSYLIPVANGADTEVRQSCSKAFHVSPFMDMAMVYDFHLSQPGETLVTTIRGGDMDGRPMISATFAGTRLPLTDANLVAAFFRYPLLTLKVVAGIHWEAAKLLLKGLRLRPAPAPPTTALTVAGSEPHPPVGQHTHRQRRPGDMAFVPGRHDADPHGAPAAQILVGEQA